MSARHVDAVVVGAGHNGLVAANMLADAGWDVLVLEANAHAGGAVWSDRSLHPQFVTDWYSAFYPLGFAAPTMRRLELERHGLRWTHAPSVLAHVFPDDRCALLSRDLDVTAESLERFAPGDGQAWRGLVGQFAGIQDRLLDSLFQPFPPVRAGLGLARQLGVAELLRFARFAVQPVRRAGQELFDGEGAPMLLAGNALHTDLPPEAAASALYGWLLAMLGQTVGFPVPVGGSGMITDALVRRLLAAGGQVRTGTVVENVLVAGGRATGVRTSTGETVTARAVLADVGAPALYGSMLDRDDVPPRLLADLRRFQWDSPTLKLDWALSAPVPWTAADARGAGTVHFGADLDGLTRYAASLAMQQLPRDPFLLFGQMTTSDVTRSPAGTESAWAYTHLPDGLEPTVDLVAEHVARVEEVIEARAPGFRASVLARRVQAPGDLESADMNLVGGAVGGGTSNMHQQLFFRPVPGLGGAATPVDGLFLASAGAHPGGGVHGGPGANAARAALRRSTLTGRALRRVQDIAFDRIYRPSD